MPSITTTPTVSNVLSLPPRRTPEVGTSLPIDGSITTSLGERVTVLPIEKATSPDAFATFAAARGKNVGIRAVSAEWGASGGKGYFEIYSTETNKTIGERFSITVPLTVKTESERIAYTRRRDAILCEHLKARLKELETAPPPPKLPPPTPPTPPTPPPAPAATPKRDTFMKLLREMKATGFSLYQLPEREFDRNGQEISLYRIRREGSAPEWVGGVIRVPGHRTLSTEPQYWALAKGTMIELSKLGFEERLKLHSAAEAITRNGSVADLVDATTKLSAPLLREGLELRAGEALGNHLKALKAKYPEVGARATEEGLATIRISLLHVLQDLEKRHPGYLRLLDNSTREKLTLSLAVGILDRQRAESNAPIIAKGDKFLVLLGDEPMFEEGPMRRIANGYGIRGYLYKGDPSGDARSATAVKESYLKRLGEFVGTGERAVVWNFCHGDDEGMYISKKPTNSSSETKRDCWYFTYREIAQTLIAAEAKRVQSGPGGAPPPETGGDAKAHGPHGPHRPLNLSRITYVFEGCHQFVMAKDALHRALHEEAGKLGMQIEGLPRIITPAQRGMVAFTTGTTESRGPISDGVIKHLEKGHTSYLVKDFVEGFDRDQNHRVATALRTVDLRSEMNGERNLRVAQDPALFSTLPTDLNQLLQRALIRIKAAKEFYPRTKDHKSAPVLLEIADRSKHHRRDGIWVPQDPRRDEPA